MGNRVLKLMVILLCSINALTWWYYTEAPLMAMMWAGIVVAFIAWVIDDIRR